MLYKHLGILSLAAVGLVGLVLDRAGGSARAYRPVVAMPVPLLAKPGACTYKGAPDPIRIDVVGKRNVFCSDCGTTAMVKQAGLDRGTKKIGEHRYEIDRMTLEWMLGNMSLLSRSARIVPEIRDGKAAGFRLYSVRPDGAIAQLGMQNADVISSINGLEVTSPEKALEIYSTLKSARHLLLGIERNGRHITNHYTIR